jgi:hypothetical protein
VHLPSKFPHIHFNHHWLHIFPLSYHPFFFFLFGTNGQEIPLQKGEKQDLISPFHDGALFRRWSSFHIVFSYGFQTINMKKLTMKLQLKLVIHNSTIN